MEKETQKGEAIKSSEVKAMNIDNEELVRRLRKPAGMVDVVLDTDTFNEIDDQFALAYLIKSDEKLNLKAIYAAPFYNEKSTGPKDGMEKSYREIMNVLDLMERGDLKEVVYKGSERYLPSEKEAVDSPAARDLVERAQGYSKENPLYVIAIGAITNIASALLMDPGLTEKIVVIWLGGNAYFWPHNKEFNLYQDVAGARVLFGSGVPVVQLPCMGVVSAFTISGPELEYHLRGKNKLCDYLVDVTTAEAKETYGGATWTRAIWDVTAVAWLLDGDFMYDCLKHSPIAEYDDRYAFDETRHFIKYVYHIKRDDLFADLFRKLTK